MFNGDVLLLYLRSAFEERVHIRDGGAVERKKEMTGTV